MFAVLYKFGLQHAVGADALSDFFKLTRIGTHVGLSPSALRTQLSKMEALTLTFQDSCEQSAPAQVRKAVLAADETFFGEVLILILMDLSSGYLLLETLQRHGFQVSEAARALGLARPALYATARRLGLDLGAERQRAPRG